MTVQRIGEACTTVDALLRTAADVIPLRDAVVEPDGTRMSYAQWDSWSDAVAGSLRDRGVTPGDVVALHLPSSIDFAVCFAALARLGAVTTAVNPRLGPVEVAGILDRSGAALVIRDSDDVADTSTTPVPVIDRTELSELRDHPGIGAARPVPSLESPAVIIWTSGTTGSPKGAWFDVANLRACADSAGVMSAPGDRKLVATPFAHAGYMFRLWDQISWGITVVIPELPWSARATVDLVVREGITVLAGVPTQWEKILELDERPLLPSLRIGVSATAPASAALVEAVNEAFAIPLIVRYAMTEAPSIAGTVPQDDPASASGTVGWPNSGMEVVVVDSNRVPVRPNVVGNLVVRGRCVMRGYWHDPERTSRALDDDGWLHTGDLGALDAAGRVIVAGRTDDTYNRGGYKVHPLEVEATLQTHPEVARAAVVGSPRRVIGEIGVAFIVPTNPASTVSVDELRAWVSNRLADYKAPDEIVFVDQLPLTSMLKLDRVRLQEQASELPRRTKRW